MMCKNDDYILDDEVIEKVHSYFERQILLKNKNFANGRLVRNLYDDLVMNQAKRIIDIVNPSIVELSTIKQEGEKEMQKAQEQLEHVNELIAETTGETVETDGVEVNVKEQQTSEESEQDSVLSQTV